MTTFRGTFEHSLDAKHRLTIPARYRGVLGDGVVLALSHELELGSARSIAIWTPAAFDAFTTRMLSGLNPGLPKARELKRFYFSNSFDTELDSANRVMIPPPLIDYAGLQKEVTVTGAGDCLEVWDRELHRSNLERTLTRIPELTASLGDTA